VKRALVLVEGPTEEQFVNGVLQPHLWARSSTWITPTILNTKVVKSGPNFKGGVLSYSQVKRDIDKLLQDQDAAFVTTLLDYYGLPTSFPGMATRPDGTARQRVDHVQQAFGRSIDHDRFVPFLALHELEAWLFCDLSERTAWIYQGGDLDALRQIRQSVASPEDINEGYTTAPSRRVIAAFPGYQKPFHGPLATMEIGVEAIRQQCPHFDEWLTRLEIC
jgi:hypothetical protein